MAQPLPPFNHIMSNYSLARRTVRKRRFRDSKNRISNVALSLFIKKGVNGTTTKEIAKKAGIAEGTIYKHFKSKGDLALELFTKNLDKLREKLLDNTTNLTDPKDMLRVLIQNVFDFAKSEPKAYSYIVEVHATELKKLPKEIRKPKDLFVEAIRLGIQKGDFREIDENLGAALVIGMITRTILFLNNGFIDSEYSKLAAEVVNSGIKVLGR